MAWRERIVRALGGVTAADLDARVTAAVAQATEQVSLLVGRDPGEGFTRISQQPERDLPGVTRDREIELAYFLYKTNILAGRMVELKRDFVVGDGFQVSSPDPEVQRALDEFWTDPVNRFDQEIGQRVLELGLYGEAAYPVFTTPNMGRVRLGYLDPARIDQVIADPENAAILIGIETKGIQGKRKRYPIVLSGEERAMLSPEAQRLRLSFPDNPIFFFTVNRVTNATRGSSDLLRKLDWLEAYEGWMFGRLEYFSQLGAFIWDVLLKGMNADQIREWLRDNPPPKPNSVRAHNEQVEWNAVSPELKAADIGAGARLFRNHILSDDGWPEHWFSEGGDVNRASAAEMGDPIIKSLTARQGVVKQMIVAMQRYNLRSRVAAGSLPRTVTIERGGEPQTVAPWEAFEVSAPEIASRDLTRLGGVIVQVAQSLAIARQQGWIGHSDAASVFALVVGMFGREVTPVEEPEAPPAGAGSELYTPELRAMIEELMRQSREPRTASPNTTEAGREAERIGELAEAIRTMAARPAAPPQVHVTAMVAPGRTVKQVERDAQGQIVRVVETQGEGHGE